MIKLPEAKKGFVLLPRRWVVERTFGWAVRFRRLARDYERLPGTLAGLHFLAFAIITLKNVVRLMAQGNHILREQAREDLEQVALIPASSQAL